MRLLAYFTSPWLSSQNEDGSESHSVILFLRIGPGLVSISPRRSVLPVAVLAVDGAPFCGFEGNFTFLLAVGADGFVHFSGASVIVAPVSKTQFSHSFGMPS
jgi:hypothetical protein